MDVDGLQPLANGAQDDFDRLGLLGFQPECEQRVFVAQMLDEKLYVTVRRDGNAELAVRVADGLLVEVHPADDRTFNRISQIIIDSPLYDSVLCHTEATETH